MHSLGHLLAASVVLFTLLVVRASPAFADRNQRVSSRACPYSCSTERIPKAQCRDWREGDTCYIEDQRQPFPSTPRVNTHGFVTGRACPFSCSTERIPKDACRDWREDEICYVEDLTRPPGRDVAAPPTAVPPRQPSSPPSGRPPPLPPFGNLPFGGSDAGECRDVDRRNLARPRIEVSEVQGSGSFFGSKLKVFGSIEGVCLAEGGLFEHGRKVQNIPLRTSRTFHRYEFELVTDGNRDPQIRVYNVNGDRDVYDVNSSSESDYRDDRSYDGRNGYDRPYPDQPHGARR